MAEKDTKPLHIGNELHKRIKEFAASGELSMRAVAEEGLVKFLESKSLVALAFDQPRSAATKGMKPCYTEHLIKKGAKK
jgi:hypothetical protein